MPRIWRTPQRQLIYERIYFHLTLQPASFCPQPTTDSSFIISGQFNSFDLISRMDTLYILCRYFIATCRTIQQSCLESSSSIQWSFHDANDAKHVEEIEDAKDAFQRELHWILYRKSFGQWWVDVFGQWWQSTFVPFNKDNNSARGGWKKERKRLCVGLR